ncbi:MAG: hypothetical protein V4619_09490 [Bacteroidota bacterium]
MSNNRYKFKEPETTACFVCEHVMSGERPVLLVTHDEDGQYEYWQFLCGEDDHTDGNITITSMRKATQIDPSINELHELTLGTSADRKNRAAPWELYKVTNKNRR